MTKLKKITDLKSILDRCEEVGECLEWTGTYTNNHLPYTYVDGDRRTMRPMVFAFAKPGQGFKGMRVFMTCSNYRCLNPDHMMPLSVGRAMHRARKLAYTPIRVIKIAETKRSKMAKLDIEKARYIRNSDKTEAELSKELGVCQSLINRVKRGVSWGEGTVKGNIFSGLIAKSEPTSAALSREVGSTDGLEGML